MKRLSIADDMGFIHQRLGLYVRMRGVCDVYGVRRCPQDNVLWPDLTAAEHLSFYATLKGCTGALREQHVAYWLEQVDLVDARNKRTSQFSGGMRRRLCVAMAMIGAPSIVLLDEPSSSLDPASRHRLWDVVSKHKVRRACVRRATSCNVRVCSIRACCCLPRTRCKRPKCCAIAWAYSCTALCVPSDRLTN
jgi:ABC-type phosphate/phosphonate transport system ATPase subunit